MKDVALQLGFGMKNIKVKEATSKERRWEYTAHIGEVAGRIVHLGSNGPL